MADVAEAKPLFNSNDGLSGRDGGPYLDVEQAKAAERHRAVVEDREPDLDNPPANAGIQLNTAGQQIQLANVNNTPSQDHRTGIGYTADAAMADAVKSEENLLQAVGEVPAEVFEEPAEDEEPVETKSDDFVADNSTDVGATPLTDSDTPVFDDVTKDETNKTDDTPVV